MLMKAGTPLARPYDLRSLRLLGSVGEPLNPEGVVWGIDAFDQPFHDNWWQTETGGIMIANFAAMDVRPGSMGRPLPGVEAAIVHRISEGPSHPSAQASVKARLDVESSAKAARRVPASRPQREKRQRFSTLT